MKILFQVTRFSIGVIFTLKLWTLPGLSTSSYTWQNYYVCSTIQATDEVSPSTFSDRWDPDLVPHPYTEPNEIQTGSIFFPLHKRPA